ncbi:MAG: hypothetical protein JO236_09570 [Mycobacterium sp.]|uniref:hypothetical protein n=1 Tax=Mycobacterium sp. TaxID=1785 RepID=UPI001EB1868A|nr:hypothetical protein [Mycobacterium sp.]MBW0017776.1 hypothetical protein [Mycobacterium sp.]
MSEADAIASEERPDHPPLHVRVAGEAVLVIPVLVAVAFVWRVAVSYPLTDEWLLFRNAMIAHDMGWHHPISTLAAMTWKVYEHPIILTNIFYLLVAPLFHYDSRALICVSLVCFATVLAVFRTQIAPNAWTALPAACVLFAPSHYMDFGWGMDFIGTSSITLTILGLTVFSRTVPEEPSTTYVRRLSCAICLIVVGLLCSGQSALGFPALLVVGLVKRLSTRRRRALIVITLLGSWAALAAIGALVDSHKVSIVRSIIVVLTAFGGTIVGTPPGMTSFPFGWTATLGLAICISVIVCVWVAWRRGILSALALPLGLFTFGSLLTAAVAAGRPYLGNWHLMAALPATLGAYGAVLVLARHARSPSTLALQAVMTALLGLVVIGYWVGFTVYGPLGAANNKRIAAYMDGYLDNPNASKPYVGTGGWDFDSAMARFLKSNGPHR